MEILTLPRAGWVRTITSRAVRGVPALPTVTTQEQIPNLAPSRSRRSWGQARVPSQWDRSVLGSKQPGSSSPCSASRGTPVATWGHAGAGLGLGRAQHCPRPAERNRELRLFPFQRKGSDLRLLPGTSRPPPLSQHPAWGPGPTLAPLGPALPFLEGNERPPGRFGERLGAAPARPGQAGMRAACGQTGATLPPRAWNIWDVSASDPSAGRRAAGARQHRERCSGSAAAPRGFWGLLAPVTGRCSEGEGAPKGLESLRGAEGT